jgi:hypothetical protein
MQPIRILFACVLVSLISIAPAHGTAIDYQGYAYETGGFPPSAGADTLFIPLVATNVTGDLPFDLGAEELTGWITGLVSTGSLDLGGLLRIDYTPARIDIYRDAARDHDFGTSPPNASVPESFTNGAACLSGSLTDFVLFFDLATSTGAYQGNVVFESGECLARLQAERAEGFTFGGILGRAAVGTGAIPEGYDLQVDGYLEATKVPAFCPLECLAITEATFEFAPRPGRHCGGGQGEFEIEGNLALCADSALDPYQVEVRLRIGDHVQVFPPGTLRHERRRHGEHWRYARRDRAPGITAFVLERRRDESWGFEIEGRGLPRESLLPVDDQLDLEVVLGEMAGRTQVELQLRRKQLTYHGDPSACRPSCPPHAPDLVLGDARGASADEPQVHASPNPFNAMTTIDLRTTAAGNVQLAIYDVSGREVRTLQAGWLPSGLHRFNWDGTDACGCAVASGVFIYRLVSPGFTTTAKLIVAK